jgi:hypothetical protein
VDEADVRALDNRDLADLELLVRAERERRSRLSAASESIADLLRRVRADGGDPEVTVTEACAVAEVTPPTLPVTPNPSGVPEVLETGGKALEKGSSDVG